MDSRQTTTLPKDFSSTFRALLDASSDGVVICRNSEVILANDVFARLVTADSARDLQGQNFASFFEANATGPSEIFDEFEHISDGTERRVTLKFGGSDSIHVDMESRKICKASDGFTLHVIRIPPLLRGTKLDATEIQNAAHFQRMTVFAELAASLVHEIGQPLTAAWGASEVLIDRVRDADLSPEIKRAAAIVADSNQRAAVQFRRIWDFVTSRKARKESIAVDDIVADALDFINTAVRHAGITLNSDLSTGKRTYADPSLLKLATTSLVTRSATALAGRMGDRALTVKTVNVGATHIELQISHNGHQLHPQTSEDEQTENAIGQWHPALSVCRAIVEENGGRLIVDIPNNDDETVRYRVSMPIV